MDSKQKKGNRTLNENAFLVSDAGFQRNTKKTVTIEIKDKDGKTVKDKFEDELPKKSVFSQYEKLEVIAENIAKEFLTSAVFMPVDKLASTPYTKIIEDGLTYFMSSSDWKKSSSGLLSICPAVLTAMKLWRELSGKKEALKKNREKLFANIRTGIDAMLKIIYRDAEQNQDDNVPVFDASPFEYSENTFTPGFDNGRSYIDSISWAVPVFLRILNLTDRDGKPAFSVKEDHDLLIKAKFLAKWCLRYINASVIKDEKGPIGWNYTKLNNPVDAERSLNFTYAASTVYLSFFAEYEDIVKALRTLDKAGNLVEEGDSETDEINIVFGDRYWNDTDTLKSNLKDVRKVLEKIEKLEESMVNKAEEDASKSKELNKRRTNFEKIRDALDVLSDAKNTEKLKTFMWFNDDKRVSDDDKQKSNETTDDSTSTVGEVARLKLNLEQVAAVIWEKIEKRIENNFFYDDHNMTEAGEDAIKSGGQTNALFSGLLSIGIMLNAAYDEKIKDEEGDIAYRKMQDAMLLHIQKTQRFFDDLEEEGNSFGVDTLILRFSQKINDDKEDVAKRDADILSDKELAEKLRKHYIRVNSLVPLLLKTNNILSKYVIQYPQKQMGESLLQISKNRVRGDKGDSIWLWESDRYNAVATYYYVDGIFNFYDYYENYEMLYIRRYEDMREKIIIDARYEAGVRDYCEKVEKEYDERLKAQKDEYEKELKKEKKNVDIAREEAAKNKAGNEMATILKDLMEKLQYFDSAEFYKRILSGMRKYVAEELVRKYETNSAVEMKEREDFVDLLEKLRKHDIKEGNKVENGEIFSLLQALLVDVMFASAIQEERKSDDIIGSLGQNGLENKHTVEFALWGRKKLLDDGFANGLFAKLLGRIEWKEE
jgi:hypothetical protein